MRMINNYKTKHPMSNKLSSSHIRKSSSTVLISPQIPIIWQFKMC